MPIEGDTYELPLETMITAVSQKPDLAAMNSEELGDGWLNGDDWGFTGVDGVWTGGDNINLGIATASIGHARRAAQSIRRWSSHCRASAAVIWPLADRPRRSRRRRGSSRP